jgi:TP901 family phage tail tape measure protein
MARNLSVFVNIGARVGSSVGSAAAATERRFAQMGQKLRVLGAEAKAAMRGVEEAQSSRRNRIFEGVGLGYLGARALRPFVDFEDALVRMGNTAEVYGKPLERIGKEIQAIGARFGYAGRDAIGGANDFVAAGMTLKSAMGSLTPTLLLAKTAGVEVTEASQAGIGVMQNLGVSVRELGMAFDIMARAGKEGRFEINDMARAFPGLSSRAKLLGMTGLDGVKRMSAMLQITRTNARDAEEAENNLLNFLDKLTGHETLQHFDKLGVSIEAVLNKSKKNGTDFVDDMLVEIRRLTKDGTDAIALTKLFPDRQARQAALALITQRKELERIRGTLSGGNVSGTLQKDFERIGTTTKFGLGRAMAGLERIGVALGRAFGPTIGDIAERWAGFAERFAGWADRNPAIVKSIGLVAASFWGLRTAVNAVGWLLGGKTMLRFAMIGGQLAKLAFRGFAGFTSILGRGLFAAIRGVATSGFVRAGFSALGPFFMAGLRALGPFALAGLRAVAPWLLRGLGMAFGVLTGPVGWALLAASAAALIYQYREAIGRGWTNLVGWFTGTAWPAVANTWKAIDWRGIGAAIVDALTFGLASKLPGIIAKIREIGETRIGFNFKDGFTVTPPAVDRPGGQSPKAGRPAAPVRGAPRAARDQQRPPGRWRGGSVTRDKPYVVGEQGEELFVPSQSGTIVPAGETSALLKLFKDGPNGGIVMPRAAPFEGKAERKPFAAAPRRPSFSKVHERTVERARREDPATNPEIAAPRQPAPVVNMPQPPRDDAMLRALTAAAKRPAAGGNTYTVNVYPQGGDAPSIAREVERTLRRMAGGQSALLSD